MILYTGPYSTRDPDRLDITRAGCDKALRARKPAPGEILAPSARLVFPALAALKAAKTDEERLAIWTRYEADYYVEVHKAYLFRPREFEAMLARPRAVLVCFCRDPQRCHRTLAGRFLSLHGAEYLGELGGDQ